jgi:hypothetical protein
LSAVRSGSGAMEAIRAQDAWILARWEPVGPPLPEGPPMCMLCITERVDMCPCFRPGCRWCLCTSCAQRRLGHLGRWDFRENLLSWVWGHGGKGLARGRGFCCRIGGHSPGHPWGSPLSRSPRRYASPAAAPRGAGSPSPGLPFSRSPRGIPPLPVSRPKFSSRRQAVFGGF